MPPRRRRLATARQAAGHSQESLAERMGVERSTIQRWESGETMPRAWYRPRLAAALSVTGEQLDALLHEPTATEPATAALPGNVATGGVDQVEQLRRTLHDVIGDGASSAALDAWELTVARYARQPRPDRPRYSFVISHRTWPSCNATWRGIGRCPASAALLESLPTSPA